MQVYIGAIGNVHRKHLLKIASWLWDCGIPTELLYEEENKKVADQIKIAVKRGAQNLVIVGEDELREDQVIIRDLVRKDQVKVDF